MITKGANIIRSAISEGRFVFRVAEVYLKKEEQIEALAMIMVLCLLVYSFAEWVIRKGLFAPQDSGMVHRHLS